MKTKNPDILNKIKQNNGKIKYEGEYLNGKRNGKGKENDYYELFFKGEYLNRKTRNGELYDSYNQKKEKEL